jgi:hypothetical protein
MNSEDFMIRIQSKTMNNKRLYCKATLEYVGEDQNIKEDFRGDKLAFVDISFDTELSEYSQSYELDNGRQIMLSTSYHGFLHKFYNYVSQRSLYKKFPVLQKTKGISYVLLLCCICEALKLGFTTLESEIILEASGLIAGQSMLNLVKYYEQLGFSVIYPEYLELGLDQEYNGFVPMKAKVQRLISLCTVDRVSPEMLELLPVRMCKGMCGL